MSTRLASETVHDELRADILAGTLAPGNALPSERVLSERHGVNRHAVREAVKRLQQAGLVRVSHGGATRVQDWRAHGGLELLADLGALTATAGVLRAVAEMRASIGADAARLCARRRKLAAQGTVCDPQAANFDGILAEVARRQATARTFEERLERYEELWQRIVAGSDNIAYRLAFNALVSARHGRDGLDARIYAAEVDDPGSALRLAEAIESGDDEAARGAAERLLARTLAAIEEG